MGWWAYDATENEVSLWTRRTRAAVPRHRIAGSHSIIDTLATPAPVTTADTKRP